MHTTTVGFAPSPDCKAVFTKDRWYEHRVSIATKRKRYVVASEGKCKGQLFANEYFKDLQKAVDFCHANGLEIVSTDIVPFVES